MLRSLLRGRIAAFEKTWTYRADYLRDMLDAGGAWTVIRFGMVASLGHGKHAPAEAVTAARLVGTLAGDCGPCVQIGVDMAAAHGVAPEVVRGILSGDRFAMGETAALGFDFARAVLDRHLFDADEIRAEVERRWGRAAIVDLSLALTTAQMYPTVKYGLGHGRACAKVIVAGVAAPFHFAEPVTI